MNEKIRDLMLNAISLVDNISYDRDGDIHRMYIPNVFAEKFAELIIQECVEVVNNHFESKEAGYPGDKIEHHFGVE